MSLTPSSVVQHLKLYLPLFTDKFTDALTVTSSAIGAANILTVTSIAHGLNVGEYIVINGGTTRNTLLTALLQPDATVDFTTTADHDLTRPILIDDTRVLALAGFANVWDGDHDIIDVQNRQTFNIMLPTGETLAPTLDGNQYLIESIVTGVFQVATVPTVDTFTIDLSSYPGLPVNTVDNLKIVSGFRIAAAANFERAQAIYSKQDPAEPYLFVIMTDTDASKDRNSLGDGVASFTQQDDRRLTLLQSFSTSVFIPTPNDLAGVNAQDTAFSEIQSALLSALFGAPFNSDSIVKYRTVPVGNGPGVYNSAYYVHVYDWQVPRTIDFSDGFLEQDSTAFRDIDQALQILADSEAEMLTSINLDDEPL